MPGRGPRGPISVATSANASPCASLKGTEPRLLVLGRDLVGQTIASAAIGSAICVPIGSSGMSWYRAVWNPTRSPSATSPSSPISHRKPIPIFASGGDDDALATLVGGHASMQELRERVRKMAASDATVLVNGASGTGKELVARALHACSGRSGGPFAAVNCAALSPTLVEAELFGHEKGRSRGPKSRVPVPSAKPKAERSSSMRSGRCRSTSRPSCCASCKSARCNRSVRIASSPIDVRVVAATNVDLAKAVEVGTFRQDLFYRLDVLRVQTPTLDERRSDIPYLASALLVRAANDMGVAVPSVTKAAMDALLSASWPGNVRQLENVLRRASALRRIDRRRHLELGERAVDKGVDQLFTRTAFPTLAEAEAVHVQAAAGPLRLEQIASGTPVGRQSPDHSEEDHRLRPPAPARRNQPSLFIRRLSMDRSRSEEALPCVKAS